MKRFILFLASSLALIGAWADGPVSSSTFPNGATVKKTLTLQGGTVTASTPGLNASQTWNNAGVTFVGLKYNVPDTASANYSILLDLQVGGVDKHTFDKAGNAYFANSWNLSQSVNAIGASVHGTGALYFAGNQYVWKLLNTDVRMRSDLLFGFTDGTPYSGTLDTVVGRDGVGIWNFRNGSNAEVVRVSGEHTDSVNYSRGVIDTQTAAEVRIGSEKLGSGTTRAVRFISPSNFGFNGVSFGSGTGVIFIANATAPSSNPTGGGILYVEAGALKYRGSSGTVTTLAVP